jgi:transglutaminase-like putative cysteine protease
MNTPLERLPLQYLIATFVLVLLPHGLQFSPWLTLALGTLLLWRAWISYRGHTLPSTVVRFLLTLGLFALIWLDYQSLIGRQGGVAALACLATVKLFETRSQRDIKIVSLLAYFLVGAGFLIAQSQWILLWAILSMLAITGQLIQWQSAQAWWALSKQLLLMLLEAIPIAILLFFFFPRLPPLWSMPDEQVSARTGLSDEMRPGNFSQLAKDHSVAFRVEFEGAIPKPALRYWRGPVFDFFDGEGWKQPSLNQAGGPSIEARGPLLAYTMTMEPHNRNWLLALDIPESLPDTAMLSNRMQVVNSSPITERQRYRIESLSAWKTSSDDTLPAALQLPKSGNPEARKLAASWSTLPPIERVNRGLQWIRNGGYSYTLNPPLINGTHSIDLFLFKYKQGFCEHYAGAFTFLMRAAGVPSRVVGGYQGGQWNQNGHYLIVRQSNAHAWSEVWLAGNGWQRVDPTAMVAPSRINDGLMNGFNNADTLPFMDGAPPAWLQDLRLHWDSLVNNWNQWVIGYDMRKQMQLFKKLGIDEVLSSEFILRLLLAMSVVLISLFLIATHSAKPKQDGASQLWQQFCRKLAKRGCILAPNEGPLTYSLRASLLWPEYNSAINYITQQYIAARYGSDPEALLKLQQAVRHFHS